MNMVEQRQVVERVLTVARGGAPDREKRQTIASILDEHRRMGAREMTLIAMAAAIAAGGKFTTPANVFADIPPGGGLQVTHDPNTGSITVEVKEEFAPLLQLMAGADSTGAIVAFLEADQPAPPTGDYPPANLEEADGLARQRICEAVRLFTNRHYRGEFEKRGLAFVSALFGELLAMSLGIERAHESDPKPIEEWLADFLKEFAPRVEQAQAIVERVRGEGFEPQRARVM